MGTDSGGRQLPTDRGFMARSNRRDGIEVATWGLAPWRPGSDDALLLCTSVRRHEADLTVAGVRRLLLEDSCGLAEVLPTFAAVAATSPRRVVAATDYLGFRHIYHGRTQDAAIVSTSSRAVALELHAAPDREAIAIQSLLGWQLGARTLFEGVTKLGAGESVALEDGGLEVERYAPERPSSRIGLDRAVLRAAGILATFMEHFLDDHPDAGLQLTGGQDSRLLLSAVPRARRKDLRVVTLGLPGVPDVDIAAEFAERFGMAHEVLSLAGLDALEPSSAYDLCLDAAQRLDFAADPLARAALTFAESRAQPGPRISGLGGEVARGFYYLGPPTDAEVTVRRAQRLARWRMFVNEAVPSAALDPDFGSWARDLALREVTRVLTETRRPWMVATDQLYLGHRMQRWAGVVETAVAMDRHVVNPMLDDRFISIAECLDPRDKRNSRFLSRLQLELDPELGSYPLEGRPPPLAYAHHSLRSSAQLTASTLRKLRGKAVQRLRRESRPPAGGELLAQKVVAHWREHPSLLEPVAGRDVFDAVWLDAMVDGRHEPPPSAVALLVNLLAALGPSGVVCPTTPPGASSGTRPHG